MLKLTNLTKKYGNIYALDKLNLTIEDGALYGLVGPNGAGKTTAIKIMAGLLTPDSGTVEIDGLDSRQSPEELKEVIGYVPDTFGIYDNLTVWEYMEFFAASYNITGLTARTRCTALLEQVGLEDKMDFHVDSLSRGMQQRLCLARALIHDPKFLIMDEPQSGLDPRTRFEFKEIMKELNAQGKTVLISSHILSELSQMCSDLGILENGKLLISGSMDEIMGRIESSNPIRICIMDGVRDAMAIMKRNPNVQTISVNNKTFMLNFDGTREDEAALLQQLIAADIPVREFVREPGSLESYFMQITDHIEEKVIISNDY